MSALRLRPATLRDRPDIWRWLTRSDATAEMMGPPTFPDHPPPDWEAFCADYDATHFGKRDDFRIFVMEADGAGIGAIHWFLRDRVAEIDLWIADRANWGKGHGVDAIGQVVAMLETRDDVDAFIIRPSARNSRAIRAYAKAGFLPFDPSANRLPDWVATEGLDYADTVVLARFPAASDTPD